MKYLNRRDAAKAISAKTVREIYLILTALIMLFPLVYMFISSGKSSQELANDPFLLRMSWENIRENYRMVFTGERLSPTGVAMKIYTPFFLQLRNVLIQVASALVFLVVCAVPIGYVLGRRNFKGKRAYLLFLIFIQTVPLFGYLIAFYVLMDAMGFTNNLIGTGLIFAGVSMPGAIIFLRGFFVSFPGEIEEAAEVDGAGEWKKFLWIIIPMARGIIVSIVLINFMGYWNEFGISSLLLTDPDLKTISINVMMTADAQNNQTYLFPLLVLSSVPTLLIFTLFQREITTGGLTMGSLKG